MGNQAVSMQDAIDAEDDELPVPRCTTCGKPAYSGEDWFCKCKDTDYTWTPAGTLMMVDEAQEAAR